MPNASKSIVTFDLKKMQRMQKALASAPEIIREELAQGVKDLVLLIEGKAKELCAVDTGNLRASITGVVESWASAFVGTNVEYAPHVEFGTVPHVIRPRDKKALHWGSDKGPVVKSVQHPGAPAQPFMEPAFEYGKTIAPQVFGASVKRAMSRVERMGA